MKDLVEKIMESPEWEATFKEDLKKVISVPAVQAALAVVLEEAVSVNASVGQLDFSLPSAMANATQLQARSRGLRRAVDIIVELAETGGLALQTEGEDDGD